MSALDRLKEAISTIDPWLTPLTTGNALTYSHTQTGAPTRTAVAKREGEGGWLWVQLAVVDGPHVTVTGEVSTDDAAVAARVITGHLYEPA